MVRHAFAVAFIVGLLAMGSQGQTPRPITLQQRIEPILEVLDNAKLSGSLEFSGGCDSGSLPEFPHLRAPATSGGSPLQTLREMFADDPAMQVTQDPDGTIRMVESGVATDILNVKIAHISFWNGQPPPPPPYPIHNPNAALRFIYGAPEVQRFMRDQDIQIPVGVLGGALPGAAQASVHERPYISEPLDNVTFAEAMDRILKNFQGIWVYENCPRTDWKKRFVYFGFWKRSPTVLLN